jgi:hypothetical protein
MGARDSRLSPPSLDTALPRHSAGARELLSAAEICPGQQPARGGRRLPATQKASSLGGAGPASTPIIRAGRGEALVSYLYRGPRTEVRAVFMIVLAPIVPLRATATWGHHTCVTSASMTSQ